jgi:hypothetical protein
VAGVRQRRLADLVRHWRALLAYADAEHVPADDLGASLDALDAAILVWDERAVRRALREVRRHGLELEQTLQG